jgi:hypothetical protein|tara:strand:+ start:322 stop:525 length:204 start_codon:yes stop_codon:yes gene_type:complete
MSSIHFKLKDGNILSIAQGDIANAKRNESIELAVIRTNTDIDIIDTYVDLEKLSLYLHQIAITGEIK